MTRTTLPLVSLVLLAACEPFSLERIFASPNGLDTGDTGDTGDTADPEGDLLSISWQELEGDGIRGDVAWYPAADGFLVSDLTEGAVALIDTSGATLATVYGGASRFGSTLTVVDGLVVTGTADGDLLGWTMAEGGDADVEDVATVNLSGADAYPILAKVGEEVWIADPSAGAPLYRVGSSAFQGGIDGVIQDLAVASSDPCGGVPGCGLSIAADPTGNGVLLGLSGGYAQHVASDGSSDWYLAGNYISWGYTETVPEAPEGLSRVFAADERFFVAGHVDGVAIRPFGRWILPEGEIDYDANLNAYPGPVSVAEGTLDGVGYRVYGLEAFLVVELDVGEVMLATIPVASDCSWPRVATNGADKIGIACEGAGYGYIATISWPEE